MTETKRVAALVLLLSLAACPAQTPRPLPTKLGPPRGGVATVAYPAQPPTLDPFAIGAWSTATRDILALTLPALWVTDPDGVAQPSLLAREPVVADPAPTTITVDLRDDATWSDGVPITVDDLIATQKLAKGSPASAWRRDPFDRVKSVTAVTAKKARIVFTQPFTRWRSLFPVVLPAHAVRTKAQRKKLAVGDVPSGGPFVLDRWRRGRDMTFVRNPEAGLRRPELDTLRIVFVPDTPGALELLKRGDVDAIAAYQGADFARRARRITGATVASDRGESWLALVLDAKAGPLVSARVRRAVASSLDRERIAAALVTDGQRLDAIPGTPEAVASPHDLKAARKLLDDVGWTGTPNRRRNGVDLFLSLAFDGDDELLAIVAVAIRQQLASAGIQIDLEPIDAEVLAADHWPSGKPALTLTILRPVSLRALVTGPSRLADKALRVEIATADRTGATAGLARRVQTQVPVIPIADPDVSVVAVGIEQVRAASASPFWNVQEWLAA